MGASCNGFLDQGTRVTEPLGLPNSNGLEPREARPERHTALSPPRPHLRRTEFSRSRQRRALRRAKVGRGRLVSPRGGLTKQHSISRIAGIGGAFAAIVSILWEYARMAPDYRFIVEPWSLRGFELTEGWVVAAMGLGLLALFLNAQIEEQSFTRTIAVAVAAWFAAVLIAQFPDPPAIDFKLANPVGLLLTLLIAIIVMGTALAIVGDRFAGRRRNLVRWSGAVVLTAVLFPLVVRPSLVEGSSIELSVIVAIGLAVLFAAALAGNPRELAPVRVLLVSTAAAWLVVTTIAGSVRSALLREQEIEGAAATYVDTQITSGMMIAWFGCLLVFVAGVALWARRRDHIANQARARRQHEAARASAAEIEAAAKL